MAGARKVDDSDRRPRVNDTLMRHTTIRDAGPAASTALAACGSSYGTAVSRSVL